MDTPTYMLIRHKVRDFFEWKQAYDTHLMKRIEAGLIEKYLFRGADDSNEVTILYEAKDLARAQAFSRSPELLDKMKKGGVVDGPHIYFLNSYSEALAKASGF
jgi:hypothetical protein